MTDAWWRYYLVDSFQEGSIVHSISFWQRLTLYLYLVTISFVLVSNMAASLQLHIVNIYPGCQHLMTLPPAYNLCTYIHSGCTCMHSYDTQCHPIVILNNKKFHTVTPHIHVKPHTRSSTAYMHAVMHASSACMHAVMHACITCLHPLSYLSFFCLIVKCTCMYVRSITFLSSVTLILTVLITSFADRTTIITYTYGWHIHTPLICLYVSHTVTPLYVPAYYTVAGQRATTAPVHSSSLSQGELVRSTRLPSAVCYMGGNGGNTISSCGQCHYWLISSYKSELLSSGHQLTQRGPCLGWCTALQNFHQHPGSVEKAKQGR